MHERIHNRNILKEKRKHLRNSLTPAEDKLWSLLKDSQLENRKFRRQHSVGPYVLDFYCPSEKLCVELDGAGHFTDGGYEYDTERTEYLKSLNIKVVRFMNKDIFDNTEGVLEEIKKFFYTNHPCPSLTKEGIKGRLPKRRAFSERGRGLSCEETIWSISVWLLKENISQNRKPQW